MVVPYELPTGVNPRYDEIRAAGCEVEIGEAQTRGAPGGDFPQISYWCEIRCPAGRRVSGSGNSPEEAFGYAAERLGAIS